MKIKLWRTLFGYTEKDMLRLYTSIYNKWLTELIRFDVNIFTWGGLPCPTDIIELYLLRDGVCGNVVDKNEGNIIVSGGMTGVTNYPNVFTQFVYATPLTSGMFTINDNGVICKSNRLSLPDYECVDLYAHLLAHVDLSIQAVLINMRATNAFSARNESQKETIISWLRALRNGKPNVILDKNKMNDIIGDNGVKTLPTYEHYKGELLELYAMRQNLLRDYFSERGFVSDKAKTERLVTAELSINIFRTIFSISDMLEERQQFCERAKKTLGANYTVNYNEQIQNQIDALLNGGGIYNEMPDSKTNTDSDTENN